MIVEERFRIAAPPQEVWDFFLDVPRSAQCMPGVDHVEPIDEHSYRGQVQVKVGPIKARFSMEVALDDVVPPKHARFTARGTDRSTSSLVSGQAILAIAPIEADRAEIGLTIDVAIRGPLGRFGQPVIRDTVRKMTEQFLDCAEQSLRGARISSDGGSARA